jgi:hypothetical protein
VISSPGSRVLLREAIGKCFWDTHREGILPVYRGKIMVALQIPEGSLNSSQLPNHCTTRWGTWLRIDSPNIERILGYLLLDKPADGDDPQVISLGANVFAVVASSCSELRIGLCRNWHDDLALKDAARWLKSFASRARSKEKETTK